MKIGKISESVLKRTIIKEIKHKRKDVLKGAAIGNDGAVYKKDDREPVTSIATYSGDFLYSAKRAFAAAINSLAARGAEPVGVMVSILMPESEKESHLREVMSTLDDMAKEVNVQITGGHTETASNVNICVVTASAFGFMRKPFTDKVLKKYAEDGKDIENLQVVMVSYAGIEGTALIVKEKENELRTRFTRSYIDKVRNFENELIVSSEAAVAVKHGVKAMRDTSKGGVFGAIWELSEYLKCGMKIDLKAIPIKQETIEFCEFFDLNPYFIPAQGGLLIVCENGKQLVDKLLEEGKVAAVIGHLTKDTKKAIENNGEVRYLEPPKAGKMEYCIE